MAQTGSGAINARLSAAVENDDAVGVKHLLQMGADVNCRRPRDRGTTWVALLRAAFLGHSEVVKELLSAGARHDARLSDTREGDFSGSGALYLASWYGHVEAAAALLVAGADPNASNALASTPIMAATDRDHPAIVQLLLNAQADLTRRDRNGWNALMLACYLNRPSVLSLLLKAHAETECRDEHQRTPLMIACSKRHCACTKLLLEAGADPNIARPSDGWTPLMFAVRYGSGKSAQYLLAAGARFGRGIHDTKTGWTPLMLNCYYCFESSHAMALRALLEAGADPNRGAGIEYPGCQHTPMSLAKERGATAAIRLLNAAIKRRARQSQDRHVTKDDKGSKEVEESVSVEEQLLIKSRQLEDALRRVEHWRALAHRREEEVARLGKELARFRLEKK